ncbi:MAG TPA: hypothetical protein VJA21_23810 [Verrucomicrobiae bacterium]
MENDAQPSDPLANLGFSLAPIHSFGDNTPLRLCVLTRLQPDAATGWFVVVRELPNARVYLGAVCDAAGRIQEWVEIWTQTSELRDLVFSSYEERLTNHTFDQRWRSEFESSLANLPDTVIVTGMETRNPNPVLIGLPGGSDAAPFATTRPAAWHLCTDDALLDSLGLPPYSASPFRYLYQADAGGAKTFLATSADAPANTQVQGIERLTAEPNVTCVFNPHAGLIRVNRFSPLDLEAYLELLEGRAWQAPTAGVARLFQRGVYAELETWSTDPKGLPFLLYGKGARADRLNEVFLLKLATLLSMFKEVRRYVRAHQLPLLNLAPSSFRVRLPEAGEQFPVLWSARCLLVRPGQAHPLQIKSAEQKYFIRLGKTEPSPFLPEGLGAHSFGIGSVRRRNVTSEPGGVVLEGTLVAEDYLRLDPNDLLWFKLPLGEQRLEFYAHVYTAEAVGPREARFRTVPMKVPDEVAGILRNTSAFAKAPYEVWPLLSSPCDLHSLGILAIRTLLANSQSNLPVIVDDVLGLARYLGKDAETDTPLPAKLRALLEREQKLFDLVSPQALIQTEWTPQQARQQIHLDLWLDTMAWLLRLFPGAGTQCYCKNFGDVSPLALETVFDAPLQDLERLVLRLRSVLTPTLASNEEIATVIAEQLAAG